MKKILGLLDEDKLNVFIAALPNSHPIRNEKIRRFFRWFFEKAEKEEATCIKIKHIDGDGEMAAMIEEILFLAQKKIQHFWLEEREDGYPYFMVEGRECGHRGLIIWIGKLNGPPKDPKEIFEINDFAEFP